MIKDYYRNINFCQIVSLYVFVFLEKVKKNKRKNFHKLKMQMLRKVMQKQIKKLHMHK